jgi:hypothetical protein
MFSKCVVGLVLLLFLQAGTAHEFKNQQFHVDHPWARPTFALATNGAAYLSIHNMGGNQDRLTAASVDVDIAQEVQIHDVLMDGDIMRMRQITSGVAIANGEIVSFTPGGKHLMLLGLKKPLKEGESFPLTLYFENSQAMVVTVKIEKSKQESQIHMHHH